MANRLAECAPLPSSGLTPGEVHRGQAHCCFHPMELSSIPHLHNHVVEEEQEVDGFCCYHEGVPAVSEGVQAQALQVHMCKEGSWEAKGVLFTRSPARSEPPFLTGRHQ